ncbi:hypothetical protein ACZ87_03109, partial [Candidatus Erwinia dacicola]
KQWHQVYHRQIFATVPKITGLALLESLFAGKIFDSA